MHWLPLFAQRNNFDPGWIKFLFFIVVVGIAGLNQLLGWLKKANARRPADFPARPAAGRDPAADARRRLEAEVGDFLKRSQQPGGGNQPQVSRQQRKQEKKKSRQSQAEVPRGGRDKSAGQGARREVRPEGAFDERARRLAHLPDQDGPSLEAERMDAHIHEVFDHQLGQLGISTSESISVDTVRPIVNPLAAQLALTLSNPESVRQAIVMQEILSRPVHRW